MRSKTARIKSNHIPNHSKLQTALHLNKYPYQLQSLSNPAKQPLPDFAALNQYAHRLTRFTQMAFWWGRIYATFGQRTFPNATLAIQYYRSHIFPDKQDDLCLPRALFAASTSELFPQNGVILIGAFLPSRSMHAWLIEDGQQPDPYDAIWINYEPLAALY